MSNITLHNAMHSNNLSANLISLPQFDRAGLGFNACNSKLNVYDPNTG
jgi:hypothetical protein